MSKLGRSATLAVLFFILASPEAFALVQALLGDVVRVASATGVPTLAGLLIHALVFGAIVFLLMKASYKRKWRGGRGGGKWNRRGAWNTDNEEDSEEDSEEDNEEDS